MTAELSSNFLFTAAPLVMPLWFYFITVSENMRLETHTQNITGNSPCSVENWLFLRQVSNYNIVHSKKMRRHASIVIAHYRPAGRYCFGARHAWVCGSVCLSVGRLVSPSLKMVRFTFSRDQNVQNFGGGYACCASHCRFSCCNCVTLRYVMPVSVAVRL